MGRSVINVLREGSSVCSGVTTLTLALLMMKDTTQVCNIITYVHASNNLNHIHTFIKFIIISLHSVDNSKLNLSMFKVRSHQY